MTSTHIVQLGFDDSVFDNGASSDTLLRQIQYGKVLAQRRPGARMTYIILTKRARVQRFESENVVFLPVRVRRGWELAKLWKVLSTLHSEMPITVLSPQNVNELGWVSVLFGKFYSIPVVGQIHYDLFSPEAQRLLLGHGWRGWLKKKIIFFFLPRFTSLRVVGEGTRRELQARRLNYRVQTIPVPVTMLGGEMAASNQVDHDLPRVIYVGRLNEEKNLGFWLEVARRVCDRHPTVIFDILGDGPLLAELQERSRVLGIDARVRFLGNVPYSDLSAHYNNASVFLLTSSFEGFGRVLVEACAHRVPVVAPRIHGVEDIVQDGKNGYLCDPGDVDQFAGKVLRLLSDLDERRRMGEWGARWVRERFAPQKLIAQWIDWLLEAEPEPWLVPPRRASLRRWWRLSSTKYSLLRSLEYERVEGLALAGRTLDVGGGIHNSYYHLLRFEGKVESVNIDPAIRPTIIADLNEGIPIASNVYDTVISFNTFEHVYRDEFALREAVRVLKPGGSLHIIVPFLYRVHGSPYDYHRHTAYWWKDILLELGISSESITVEPLMWDPASTGFALTEFAGRFRHVRKKIAMFFAVVKQLRWSGSRRIPRSYVASWYTEHALGYYIYGEK